MKTKCYRFKKPLKTRIKQLFCWHRYEKKACQIAGVKFLDVWKHCRKCGKYKQLAPITNIRIERSINFKSVYENE